MFVDLMDLDYIYNQEFSFSLPRSFLESYISGSAFGGKKMYTIEDKEKIAIDLICWYEEILNHNPAPEQKKEAVLTAGGPGAGKTRLMRQKLSEEERRGKYYAYLDPDDQFLREKSTQTYQAQVNKGNNTYSELFQAYEDWRAASNGATQIALARLIREDYSFFYGTTSTSDQTWKFLDFLKSRGYTVKILHVTAPDDVREKSVQLSNEEFVHVTPQDVKEKGLLLPQRINDTFLKYADKIEFYYRAGAGEDALLGATWTRNSQTTQGVLKVVDEKAFDEIKKIHREQSRVLTKGEDELFWERSLMQASTPDR